VTSVWNASDYDQSIWEHEFSGMGCGISPENTEIFTSEILPCGGFLFPKSYEGILMIDA
jgi:hypothetical protein